MIVLSANAVALPRSRIKPNQWRNALRVASLRRDPKTGERYIDLMSRKVVAMALEGDKWALDHFADRLDGPTKNVIVENLTTIDQQVTRIESVVVDPDPNFLRDITAECTVEQSTEDAANPLRPGVPTPDPAP